MTKYYILISKYILVTIFHVKSLVQVLHNVPCSMIFDPGGT